MSKTIINIPSLIGIKNIILSFFLFFSLTTSIYSQKKNQITDSNTPLHLMQPDYPIAYGAVSKASITSDLEKIYYYLNQVTPYKLVNPENGQVVDAKNIGNFDTAWQKGDFRIFSYEWGVTYAGMLSASEATGDTKFQQYTFERLTALSEVYPRFAKQFQHNPTAPNPIKSVLDPKALDNAGSICWAMIKAENAGLQASLGNMIDTFGNYIRHKQYRLRDGTLARNRPLKNTVWLDDLFMSVPALAQLGQKTGDRSYYDEAVRQVLLFAEKMFNPNKNIFIHGWVEGTKIHPEFHWGRANGWAIMALVELLDVLPKDHPERPKVLKLFQDHAKGLASYQSGNGFWHQLLDKNDSYLETSATAIYTYCFAKAINRDWLDYRVFGPVTLLGWSALSTRINKQGQVTGTCVGTGMAFDPAFYYYRPTNPYAAHGYGPMLLAGAELLKLLDQHSFKIEETAIQFLEK